MTATQRIISSHKTNLFLCQHPTILYKDVHSLGMLIFCKNVLFCLHLRLAGSRSSRRDQGKSCPLTLLVQLLPHLPTSLPRQRMLIKPCLERREWEDTLKARSKSSCNVWHSWNSECVLNHTSHTYQMHIWLIMSSSGKQRRAGLSPPLIYELFEGSFSLLFIFVSHTLATYSTHSSQISGTDRLKRNMISWTFISC